MGEAAVAYGDRLPHRPLSTISLALDQWLWDGEPQGFKRTNLIIHLITTMLVLLLARTLIQRVHGHESHAFWPALAITAVWAVHPLLVSTVLYVVQRMEMLAALFTVLAVLVYLSGRKRLESGESGGWIRICIAGLCSLLALLSKENGALAPFLILAVELLLFRFATARPGAAQILKIGFSTLLVFAAVLYLFWLAPGAISGNAFVRREFTWDERLLTQLRVLPMYIGWILIPITDRYLFYYDHFEHSISILKPMTTLFGAVFLSSLAAAVWLLKDRAPLVALGIAWFFIAHALTSNLFSLELVFEHRNYVAAFGILLALGAAIHQAGFVAAGRFAITVIMLLVVGLAALTSIRSATWGDPMNLALHHVEINPQSDRAGLDLAGLYLGNDDWDPAATPFLNAAREQLERIAVLPKSRTVADQALIVLAARLEEPTPEIAWRRLIHKVET
ncbi:MAG: hypothetical protein EA370_12495, partial [Wenzhouxiangella sp.]